MVELPGSPFEPVSCGRADRLRLEFHPKDPRSQLISVPKNPLSRFPG